MTELERAKEFATHRAAKYHALNECADHLDLEWTDDPIEREEGKKLAARLRREAERLET